MTAYSITPEGASEAAKEIVDSEWTCCHAKSRDSNRVGGDHPAPRGTESRGEAMTDLFMKISGTVGIAAVCGALMGMFLNSMLMFEICGAILFIALVTMAMTVIWLEC